MVHKWCLVMPILEWLGKNEAVNTVNKVPYRLLKVNEKLSYGEQTENMIIKGDNLEALKALLPYYKGQVKCIYIDPPYNTGSRIDADGNEVGYDDNLEHSIWCSMMYTRLELLKELLASNGCILVQTDKNESYLLYNGILGDKKPDSGNVLTQKVFDLLPKHDGKKVIYGEATMMSAEKLKQNNIIFKQTPYEIKAN